MNFIYHETENVEHECINLTIIYANVINTSLIIIEENYGSIDDDDSTCHGYYIIIFDSFMYTLQVNLKCIHK